MKTAFQIFSGLTSHTLRTRWTWTQATSSGFTVLVASFLPGMIVLFLWQSIPVWRLTTEAIYANAAGEGE